MTGPQVSWLPGGRLHLNHGPIDLVCQACGPVPDMAAAYDRAIAGFQTILTELTVELAALRAENAPIQGDVARRMAQAVAPFRPTFITPMAAVAGAATDTILAALVRPGITRAYVNNGGDIALHLTKGQSVTAALGTSTQRVTLCDKDVARGIAISGWTGRSHSLGIADAGTVLARTAAIADAAAIMIANAFNLDHPAITRAPARSLKADSDLGDQFVTVHVGPISASETVTAMDNGLAATQVFRDRGLIESAALFLNSTARSLGPLPVLEPACA